jgi:hypothetical protein
MQEITPTQTTACPLRARENKVQEEASKMKGLQLKTSIDKDMTLNFLVWFSNGIKEAMLMHVTGTFDAIKTRCHFKAYDEAQAPHVEQKEGVKLTKASLSLLEGASKGSGKSRKTLKKAKEAKGVTKVPDNPMRVTFQADLENARSNKHYKQNLVWVLVDSGSDGNLVFVNKDKPMLLPSSKWLVPQSWNISNGIFQTKH